MASQSVRVPGSVRFGEGFEFDLHAYRLRRAGRALKLERIPMEVLAALIEQRGQLVSREYIAERIWGKGAFLDTDNSINGAIRKIRQVLKDDPEQPRFIQTVTGKGYRFIAPVTDPDPPRPVAVASFRPTLAAASPAKAVTRRWPMMLAAVIILAALVVLYFQWSRSWARSATPNRLVMLAVLPFENLTGDASQDYFSDGMTEELIAQLGDLDPQHLGVIARTSAMQYKHNPKSLDQIGRELGVQYTLEGSVRRDSGKLRITAQLIQVQDQTHVWAREYDRETGNLLALQGEIAQAIADEIQSRIGGRARSNSTPTTSIPVAASPTNEAYVLYLKGLYFLNKRTARGLQQSIEYFGQAAGKDPGYARAYAGTAEAYALMSGYTGAPPSESMSRARVAAQRALELDERVPEAHAALAVIAQNYDWDWPTAEREYRRAIQLNPNYATGHHWYAECLALQGRFDEAFPEIEIARQLDPLSLIIATDYGAILYFSRQYDRSIEQFRAVLDMEPNFPRAHMLVWALVQKGLFAEALAHVEAWRRTENIPWSWTMTAYIYGRSGNHAKANEALARLREAGQHQPLDPLSLAIACIGMADNDKAMVWLEKANAEHSSSLSAIKVDPTYDPLRNDPRFQELVRRIGLAR